MTFSRYDSGKGVLVVAATRIGARFQVHKGRAVVLLRDKVRELRDALSASLGEDAATVAVQAALRASEGLEAANLSAQAKARDEALEAAAEIVEGSEGGEPWFTTSSLARDIRALKGPKGPKGKV